MRNEACLICAEHVPAYGDDLCERHEDEWGNSVAYTTRADWDSDQRNYLRQFFDWLETKRRERMNGSPS